MEVLSIFNVLTYFYNFFYFKLKFNVKYLNIIKQIAKCNVFSFFILINKKSTQTIWFILWKNIKYIKLY